MICWACLELSNQQQKNVPNTCTCWGWHAVGSWLRLACGWLMAEATRCQPNGIIFCNITCELLIQEKSSMAGSKEIFFNSKVKKKLKFCIIPTQTKVSIVLDRVQAHHVLWPANISKSGVRLEIPWWNEVLSYI